LSPRAQGLWPGPGAETLNQRVRSRFTPLEPESFKPAPVQAPSNPLDYRAFDIRTKIAVVRLRQRKAAGRDEKGPKMGLLAGPSGSDNLAGMPAFCGFPTADQERKKNVPNGQTGGGRGTRNLGTICGWRAFVGRLFLEALNRLVDIRSAQRAQGVTSGLRIVEINKRRRLSIRPFFLVAQRRRYPEPCPACGAIDFTDARGSYG
jgi:hypothetical protein